MRREACLLAACVAVLAAGCSRLERLSIVKPTAERGDWTQVAPEYDVRDPKGRGTPGAAGQLLASAMQAYGAGQPDLAVRQAQAALKSDPKLADAHGLLGAIANARGDRATAGRHYQQAATLAPATGAHANNYGTWLCGNGRAAESVAWFDRALADPSYATPAAAQANAGSCASQAGKPDQAEARWRLALEMDPANVPSLAGLASLHFARGRYMDARAFAERWLAVAPNDAEGLQLASQIESKLGDTDASARYLHRLQALAPGATNAPRPQ
jgi:type IV pilus assembly protein PilF